VLDIKWGRGAFRETVADAVELGLALRQVARDMGMAAEAVVTDMNQPLGPALGTACEVRAALAVLDGGGDALLRDLSVHLAAVAMRLRGHDRVAAGAALERALADGSARVAWDQLVRAHGGDPDPGRLPRPRERAEVRAAAAGVVHEVDAEALGWVAVEVGAGRRRRDEALDHSAGVEVHARLGDRCERGQPLATVLLGERPVEREAVVERVRRAFTLAEEAVEPPELVLGPVDEIR
jgi:thymidine phosphorylase